MNVRYKIKKMKTFLRNFKFSLLFFLAVNYSTDHLQLLVKHFSVYPDRLGIASYLSLFLHDWQRVEAKEVKET